MNIIEQMPSEAKIKTQLRQILFGQRIRCPRCQRATVHRSENRYRCRACRKPFSITSSSWLSGMKITYQQLWLLVHCWQRRYAFVATSEIVGVSHVTVRRWFRRFQYHLPENTPYFQGEIEIDESFVGKRRTHNQGIVIGAYHRTTKQVVLQVIPNRTQETTDRFLLNHIHTNSTVYTDGWSGYEGIDSYFGYKHQWCNHSQYEFGPTNHIEAIWSALKRFITRTYHHIRVYWLPYIVREFQARINTPKLFTTPVAYLQNSLKLVPYGSF